MQENRRQLKEAQTMDHAAMFASLESNPMRASAIKDCYSKRADVLNLENMNKHLHQTQKVIMVADREKLRKQRMHFSPDELQFGINRADYMNKTLALGVMGETALVPETAAAQRLKSKN